IAVPMPSADVDQRVILQGISWQDYSVLRDLLDGPGVRMTYLKGALEIMSPSRLHEDVKKRIARLLELYALERDVALYAYGSTAFRLEAKERGLEPDECYVVGKPQSEGYPELAIEVSVTRGGIDKLEVYRGLGVREVWIWDGTLATAAERGKGAIESPIAVYVLGPEGYEPRTRSEAVPGIDLDVLARYVAEPDQHAALVAYRERLRGAAP
ncbi:MAG TPA: Uma2 family endonuclease, partial [Polyangiaceae bacterium]|nr:Uma2 family endonuclease [Polyangiaceae bacterium]